MKLTNSSQMREMDSYVIEDLGVTGKVLMSKAAQHIAAAALERIRPGGLAAVFCGTGNNGGDGIGAAAFLADKGVPVRVFLIGNEEKLTYDSREMRRRLDSLHGSLEPFVESAELEQYVKSCDVVIDAIFGIGLNTDLRGDALAAVKMINASGAFVIAADIPSGVHADTGAILGASVKADVTVTFTMAKPGHFVEPGCTRCGEVLLRDIGIPQELVDGAASRLFAVTREDVSLPKRRPDSHKGDYGRLLIVAGSTGYTGAPALCARAASRMGAGLVFLGVPAPVYNIMAAKLCEEMPFPLPADKHGRLGANAAGEILRRAAGCDALLIGPGLGTSDEVTELVLSVIRLAKAQIILDADGINAIAGNAEVLDKAAHPVILTPHPGEFRRLIGSNLATGGLSPASVLPPGTLPPGTLPAGPRTPGILPDELLSRDRLGAARGFAAKFGCVLVLKGHRTITSLPDGRAYINTTGGPAMAKGGTGDVLAGMIAALVAQKFPVKDSAAAAVYIHGLAGDMCAAGLGEYSVIASDIIAMLPKAAKSVAGQP